MIWAPHPHVDALLLRMSSLQLEPVLVAESHALLHLHNVMLCHVIIMSCHVIIMTCHVIIMSCHVMTWWMLSTTSSRSLSSTLLCTAQMSRVTLNTVQVSTSTIPHQSPLPTHLLSRMSASSSSPTPVLMPPDLSSM